MISSPGSTSGWPESSRTPQLESAHSSTKSRSDVKRTRERLQQLRRARSLPRASPPSTRSTSCSARRLLALAGGASDRYSRRPAEFPESSSVSGLTRHWPRKCRTRCSGHFVDVLTERVEVSSEPWRRVAATEDL